MLVLLLLFIYIFITMFLVCIFSIIILGIIIKRPRIIIWMGRYIRNKLLLLLLLGMGYLTLRAC